MRTKRRSGSIFAMSCRGRRLLFSISNQGERYMRKNLPLLLTAMAVFAMTASAVSITGAGATFPYPMYSKWFNEYKKLHPDIEINYQSRGSGAGIQQVTSGTVDFGATDGPMN